MIEFFIEQIVDFVLDEWVIMPNHIHIIIVLRNYDFDNGISNIGKFQIQTSKHINILRNTLGRINWQNDYYDVIIITQNNYLEVKQYIIDNLKNGVRKTMIIIIFCKFEPQPKHTISSHRMRNIPLPVR